MEESAFEDIDMVIIMINMMKVMMMRMEVKIL